MQKSTQRFQSNTLYAVYCCLLVKMTPTVPKEPGPVPRVGCSGKSRRAALPSTTAGIGYNACN